MTPEYPAHPLTAPTLESFNLDQLREEIRDLQDRLARTEETAVIALRVAKCADPQPCHRDRGEILKALLLKNGGRMMQADARRLMRLSKQQFSNLLGTMKDEIEVRSAKMNKRQNILILK